MTKEKLPVIPVGYRLLIKQDAVENKSTGGIIMATDDEQSRKQAGHNRGTVMAMGEECYKDNKSNWCQVGDKVMFSSYAGKKFLVSELENRIDKDDVQYWHVMNDEDILGVLNV